MEREKTSIPDRPGRVVYSAEQIEEAVGGIAGRIAVRLDGEEPTLLILLKGGVMFGSDLIRAFPQGCNFDFIGVSSYGEALASSGRVDFYLYNLQRELIDNRPVILVDDICDSGTTFSAVAARVAADFAPSRLLSCSLIWRDGSGFTPDFHGFQHAGDEFLVGYGLGAGEQYRSLGEIMVLERDDAG